MKRLHVLLPALRLIDPHTCTDSSAVRNLRSQLYEGLIGYGADGLEPALAEGWQCEDDARAWTFRLRPEARFHDGRPVRSEDVIYSLRRAAAPEAAGELFTVTFHSYLTDMELQAPDRQTVRLRAPEPMADLLELLCDMAILPEGSLPAGGPPDPDGTPPPGSGPYALDSADSGVVHLRAFDGHWGGRRQVPRVELRAEPEEGRRLEALRRGEAQLVTDLSPPSFNALRRGADGMHATALAVPSNLCVIYLMRCDDGALADRRVRQALNWATNTPALIDELFLGQARPLNGPLSDLHFGHDPRLAPYAHEPQRARELLRQAGLRGGLQLTVHTPRRLPDEAPRLSQMLAEQWREAGITAHLEFHEDRVAYARSIAEKRFGGICCFDSSPLSTFRVLREKLDSRYEGPWWQHYDSPRANELLSAAARSPEPAVRQGLYRQAYRIYHDEAPWLFLYQPHRLWGAAREAAAAVAANRQSLIRFR
jgi:peptide/nickel transport system substrate-binding protein